MCLPMRAGTDTLVNRGNGAESSEKFGKLDAKLDGAQKQTAGTVKTKWMLYFYFLSTKAENAFRALQELLIN